MGSRCTNSTAPAGIRSTEGAGCPDAASINTGVHRRLLAAAFATCVVAPVDAAPPPYVAVLIPTLGGATSYPSAINAAGDIVGTSYVADHVNQHAFLFTGGTPEDLGTLSGGDYSRGLGINRHRMWHVVHAFLTYPPMRSA